MYTARLRCSQELAARQYLRVVRRSRKVGVMSKNPEII
jgi:hypothetical protein